jgi:hypothetical protein
MNRLTLTLVTLCCASILWPVHGTTLFSDDFSDTNAAKRNWVWLGNNTTMTFSGGAAVLKNTDTTYAGFLVHSFQTKPSRFTLSAKITASATVSGAGLMVCMSTASSVGGYTLQLDGQNVSVYKFVSGAGSILNPGKSSSAIIAGGTNTIAVSKSSDTFNIFVNGQYILRFNDAAFNSGDIALVVPKKSQITVDDVSLTDQFLADNTPTCFADSFLIAGTEGWNTSPMIGPGTFGAGKCVLNDTDNVFSSIIYNDGNYQTASIRAAVRQTSGAGMYGVCFVSVINGDSGRIDYKPYAFLVDSLRRYSIVYPDSASVRTRPAQSFIYGSLGTDTLEVVRFAKHFMFKVNGFDVGETIPVDGSFRIDGAGLYVSKKTSATYDFFIVGGDSTGAFCTSVSSVINRPILSRATLPQFGATSVVYDLMGRKIGALNRVTFGRLLSGPYIVVTSSTSGGSVLKAVRVMKLPK